MKLGIFVSDFRGNEETLQRLKAEKLGVILVSNGTNHAVVKEDGKASPILEKEGAEFYVLSEDLQSRGFATEEVDEKVKVITYDGLVDLMMNEYEKLAWL